MRNGWGQTWKPSLFDCKAHDDYTIYAYLYTMCVYAIPKDKKKIPKVLRIRNIVFSTLES